MGKLVIFALLGIFAVVHCEIHTLQYIYTSLSKAIEVPDVYKFTAMGILDDRGIDYYNSYEKVKKPTQGWMAENLPQDYWDKGTQSRKSKEEWFNVNVKILMDRMRQNDSDVHILQWMHGCTIEKTPDGETKFVKGFDQYGYDGNDFLSFNDADMQWVAPVTEAKLTKTKWDSVDILNQYTKGYLERECVEWLEKFLTYSEAQLRQASPPEVTIFARKSPQPDSRDLVCFATGFYPKEIEMVILQNDVPLTESNGVTSSGVRPNGDGTHQLMKTLTIGASDKARYSCRVNHRALKEPVKKDWDGTCCNCASTLGIGVAVGIPIGLLLAAAVAGCLAYVFRDKLRGLLLKRHTSNGGLQNGIANGPNAPLLPTVQTNNGAPANEPPEVIIFARKSPQPDSRRLVCFATGFYPKDIEMDILQNDVPLTESNGVTSSGVRPNGDGTHQLMKTLTIGASDKARYTCRVNHRALTEPVKKDWVEVTDETASNKSEDSGHGSNSSGSSNENLKGIANGPNAPLLPTVQTNNGAPANGQSVETV